MSRCFGDGDPLYERYHDTEWGFPVADERALFELMSLEAFQSGLSWRTILAKREAFRRAFANFDADAVARFGAADVKRLLEDAGIVRNRAKIEATIGKRAGHRAVARRRPSADRDRPAGSSGVAAQPTCGVERGPRVDARGGGPRARAQKPWLPVPRADNALLTDAGHRRGGRPPRRMPDTTGRRARTPSRRPDLTAASDPKN